MAFPTVTERYGSLSATGFAKETTFGTPVTATGFLPMMSNSMDLDPGWYSPHVMQNNRALQIYSLYGEAKFVGAINGPLFPTNGIQFLTGAIGFDNQVGYGVTGNYTTPTSTTLASPSIIGATTVTLTSGTGFAIGQEIIIDAFPIQERRRITNVAGAVITVDVALGYAHASLAVASTGTTTTLSAPSLALATSVTVTSAAGITNGTYIQIDTNGVFGGFTSEVRKVTNVVSTTLTLDTALVYGHASGANVTVVNANLFNHTVLDAQSLSSFTVEKNIGGYQSLQFAGCKIGKLDLKAPVGNSPIELTADMTGRQVAVLNTPTAVSVFNENPFVFAEATLTTFGNVRNEVRNVNITIDNGLKSTYTYSGSHGPSFITPVTLHCSGTFETVFSSLNDATYGDFTNMQNGTLGQLALQFVHPSNAGSVQVFLPEIVLNKYANDLKMEDVVLSSISFEALKPVSGSIQNTITAIVSDGQWLSL